MGDIKKIIKEIDELTDLCSTWVSIDVQAKINIETSYVLEDNGMCFHFNGIFCNCKYSFAIDRKDIVFNKANYLLEGDFVLHNSFKELIEKSEVFSIVKALMFKYEELDFKKYA